MFLSSDNENGNQTKMPEEFLNTITEYTDITVRPTKGFEESGLYKPMILTYTDELGIDYSNDNDVMKAEIL